MGKSRKISLKTIAAPASWSVVDAPPIIKTSDHSVDYTCGNCGTINPQPDDPLHQVQFVQFNGCVGGLSLRVKTISPPTNRARPTLVRGDLIFSRPRALLA